MVVKRRSSVGSSSTFAGGNEGGAGLDEAGAGALGAEFFGAVGAHGEVDCGLSVSVGALDFGSPELSQLNAKVPAIIQPATPFLPIHSPT